ncbi:MAG: PAS domain S-box protein [Planctomycetota bacterium]|nr:PAS domain S-box protein [Planctomycetota bacterium]
MNSRSSRMMQELQNEELPQSREDLLASLARYTDLFELAPLGYLVLGPDGTIRQLNSAAASLLNIDPSQVPKLPFTAFVAAADRPAFDACLRLVIDTKAKQACEVVLERRAGCPFCVRIEAAFSERRQACYATVLDITDRRQAETQMRQAQTLLLSITEGTTDAIYVKDRQGRYLMFNSGASRITGKSVEEVLGQDDRCLFSPDEARRVMELDRRIMEAGVVETIEEVVSPFGRPESFLSTKGPVRDAQGHVVGLFGIARDITNRKRAEEEARTLLTTVQQERVRLSALIDSIPDEIWFADTEKRFALANPSALREFGLSHDEKIDVEQLAQRLEVLRPDGSPRPVDEAPPLRALLGEVIRNQEEMVRSPASGELRYREVCSTPVRDAAGHILGSVSVVRDITDRKRADREMRRQTQRLEDLSRQLITVQETERRHLARELHDEIGQVLTAVHISLQQLKGKAAAAALPRLEESIAIVNQAIDQVRGLSLNLRPAMLDDFGLEAALRWYVDREQPRLGCAVTLTAESSGPQLPPELKNTCFRVTQEALTNVLRHARAQQVWIELRQQEEAVELVVRDDGVGFDLTAAH